MNQNWHGTLIRHMLLLITGCLVVGLVSGYYGWSLAVGLGLMRLFVGDEYPDYKKFFTTRWHMTAGHKAYVPAGKCGVCQAAKRPRAEGK